VSTFQNCFILVLVIRLKRYKINRKHKMPKSKDLLRSGKVFIANTEELDEKPASDTFSLVKPPKRVLFEIPAHCTDLPKEIYDWTHYYIAQAEDRILEFHKTRGETTNSYEKFVEVKLPSRTGLALVLNVTGESITNWGKKFPNFKRLLEHIDAKQKDALLNGGLSGRYNPSFSKFLLSSIHGMKDGIDITSNGNTIETFGMGHEALAKREADIIDLTTDTHE